MVIVTAQAEDVQQNPASAPGCGPKPTLINGEVLTDITKQPQLLHQSVTLLISFGR